MVLILLYVGCCCLEIKTLLFSWLLEMVLLLFQQSFELCYSIFIGNLASYNVSIGSFSTYINLTGLLNFNVNVSVPAIGVQTMTTLTVTATSQYNEVISTQVNVTGVVTLRSTVESLLTYPTVPLVAGSTIGMSLNNLSQNCGDFYQITLDDPTNTTVIGTANNTNFNAVSTVTGYYTILINYTTRLGTISSSQYSVSRFPKICKCASIFRCSDDLF
jgi:hypothetical protein